MGVAVPGRKPQRLQFLLKKNTDYYQPPSDLGDNEPCNPMIRVPKSSLEKRCDLFKQADTQIVDGCNIQLKLLLVTTFLVASSLLLTTEIKYLQTGFQNWKTGMGVERKWGGRKDFQIWHFLIQFSTKKCFFPSFKCLKRNFTTFAPLETILPSPMKTSTETGKGYIQAKSYIQALSLWVKYQAKEKAVLQLSLRCHEMWSVAIDIIFQLLLVS